MSPGPSGAQNFRGPCSDAGLANKRLDAPWPACDCRGATKLLEPQEALRLSTLITIMSIVLNRYHYH